MDKYIIGRRVRIRLAWFKRYEEIGNVSQVCKEFGIAQNAAKKVLVPTWLGVHWDRRELDSPFLERLPFNNNYGRDSSV